MQVNPKTLSNRLKEAGSGFRHHLSDSELLEALQETCHIDTHGRATGHRVRQAGLSSRAGIRAPREQILRVSREHDPEGNAARQERLIHRRQYTITEPMVLWHIDSEFQCMLSVAPRPHCDHCELVRNCAHKFVVCT